jgi:hypothetical protein
MQSNETNFYYNEKPFLIKTAYDIYDGMEIALEEKNDLFNLLENGFVSTNLLSVSETFRAIIFFIEELDNEEEQENHQNWFYNSDKSIVEKIIETIEKHWKRNDWQYLGQEAIYIYYFNDLGTEINEECYTDEYWIIDFNNNQAESKCGKYKIMFNQNDWNSFKEDDFQYISNFIPLSTEEYGVFYNDNEIKNKTAEILKIISEINLCLQETNKKIKTINSNFIT